MATYTTKQQKAVLDCLSERADSPVSAAAIVDALREQGEHIGIATVYRQLEKLERRRIPADADYADIQGLRLEAREKLSAIRPQPLGQASSISGVSPAAIAALMIWLHARGKDGEA